MMTKILGLCGIAAALFFALADGLGSALTPDYSFWSDAISELVERNAPRKSLVDPLLVAYHSLVILFAFGLYRAIYPIGTKAFGPLLLGCAGLTGVILTLFFPCDTGCEPFVSVRGTLHIFLAIPMGISILLAIWLIASRMQHSAEWISFVRYSRATAFAGLLLAVPAVMLAESSYVGILERLLTWTYLQWYVVIGSSLFRGRNTQSKSSF